MHLRRLKSAGLIETSLEVSDDGRAMNYLTVAPFVVALTPETIAEAARTLSPRTDTTDESARSTAEQEEDE